jgi:crossover junction endodeoxyribonuclease RuvC
MEDGMTSLWVLGVDPGQRGALVILRASDEPPQVCGWLDMPRDGKHVDVDVLGTWLRERAGALDAVVVEQVGSRPEQGVVSMFTFGQGLGAVLGALGALGVPKPLRPAPNAWKASMGLHGGKDGKTQSRKLAMRLLPASAHLFERVKDDGRAEAALLAWWGALRVMSRSSSHAQKLALAT